MKLPYSVRTGVGQLAEVHEDEIVLRGLIGGVVADGKLVSRVETTAQIDADAFLYNAVNYITTQNQWLK